MCNGGWRADQNVVVYDEEVENTDPEPDRLVLPDNKWVLHVLLLFLLRVYVLAGSA